MGVVTKDRKGTMDLWDIERESREKSGDDADQ